MAADVTLLAIPNRPTTVPSPITGAPLSAWDFMLYRTDQWMYPDDEALLDEEGKVWAMTHGDGRKALDDWLYNTDFSGGTYARRGPVRFNTIEVGPWSPMKAGLGLEEVYGGRHFLPQAQVEIWEYFRDGRVLTPGVAKAALAILNRTSDHSSIYSTWGKRGTGRGKRKWRANRHVRARVLKRWLNANIGNVAWVESW